MLDRLFIIGAEYLFIVIAGIAFVYFLRQPRVEQKRLLLHAALTLPLVYVVSKLGAFFYNDPRPFVAGHFAPLIAHEADNGFPSDHVLLCASIAAIVYPSSMRLSLALWVATLVVGFARVYSGLHHAVDIIGSMLMAIVVAAIVYRAINWIQRA